MFHFIREKWVGGEMKTVKDRETEQWEEGGREGRVWVRGGWGGLLDSTVCYI